MQSLSFTLDDVPTSNLRCPTIWQIGGEDIRFRIPLLLALRDRGFQVAAVGSEASTAFTAADIPYYQYSLERSLNPWADWQTSRQLLHLLRQHQPDVIHAFDTKPTIFAPIVAQTAQIPARIRTITGMGYVFSSRSPLALGLRPLYRHLHQHAAAATHVTVFQNPDDRAYFRQHGMVQTDQDALVLGSGIDVAALGTPTPPETLAALRTELHLTTNNLVVIMVARLVTTKGVREFLQAAQQVCWQMPQVRFLLVGAIASEGRQAVPLSEIQAAAPWVQYLGVRQDIPALLSLSDLFVLPSYYREGVPRVLLEAGMQSLPLITTRMPGCQEVVRDGWNGLLVPPRDASAVATAILQVLHSSDRSLMGERSRSYVCEHFSLTQVADAYAAIYRRVLGVVSG